MSDGLLYGLCVRIALLAADCHKSRAVFERFLIQEQPGPVSDPVSDQIYETSGYENLAVAGFCFPLLCLCCVL